MKSGIMAASRLRGLSAMRTSSLIIRKAEHLYHVHGEHGIDPTEGPASAPYRHPPVSHEPRIQELYDDLQRGGHHPFPLPLGILLDEKDGKALHTSACVRCAAFDGFPCLVNGKADAQVICVDPALAQPNVQLLTGAYVKRLETDASGRVVTKVLVERDGQSEEYSADIVVVSCGAINSATLLLRSANDKHPNGLANSSDVVGRHYMRHNNSAFMAISKAAQPDRLPENPWPKRFLLSVRRLGISLGRHPDAGKDRRRNAEGRSSGLGRLETGVCPGLYGRALHRFLGAIRRSAAPR